MVGRQVATACSSVVVLHLLMLLVSPDGAVSAWRSSPGGMLVASAVTWLAAFAVALAPDARRDTRASVSPFRSGLMIVQVRVAHARERLRAPERRTPVGLAVVQVARGPAPRAPIAACTPRADGLPSTVAGQVVMQDRDDRDGGVVTVTDAQTPRPLPPLQAQLAREVTEGRVFYSSLTGRWYRGAEGAADAAEITGPHGRGLRTMLAEKVLAADPAVMPDARRARPMTLTVTGRSRLDATRP